LVTVDRLPIDFSRYVLTGLLGEGGMGRVFAAELRGPEGFRKEVALKLIRSDLLGRSPRARSAFLREARIGGLLRHPNIVDCYDFGIEEGHPYLVMERVDGPSLQEVLRRVSRLPPTACLDLAIQLCDGLGHAHELRVVGRSVALIHRDLKPANVLVMRQGLAKIVDFGLARAALPDDRSSQEIGGGVSGTPGYMSPEQWKGQSIDGRSDLFSLGLLLFEVLSGQRFFRAESVVEAAAEIAQIEREFPRLAPLDALVPGMTAVVQRCLRPRPSDRFSDVRSLSRRLSKLARAQSPGPSLRGFLEELRGVGPTVRFSASGIDAVRAMPPLSTLDTSPSPPVGAVTLAAPRQGTNLPVRLDSFVGRERELDTLGRDVTDGSTRLLTLMGAGGTGKTRLAQQIARRCLAEFPGGAWFCDLAEVDGPASLARAVAFALDVPLRAGDPIKQLGDVLAASGRVLLVLDNFEQTVDQSSGAVESWLRAAPEAVFLVTSRIRLGVEGEQVFALGSLDAASAVQLFEDRARQSRRSFAVTAANREAVEAIIDRLDRLSLAIELAAARVGNMALAQILKYLDRRFELLAGGGRVRLPRQRTLRGAIDWSWGLMKPLDRAALVQCALFRGGFTLESAEAVLDLDPWPEVGWALDVLTSLQDQSLLRLEGGPLGSDRYFLSESVREYAVEKLGSPGAVVAPDGTSCTGPQPRSALVLRFARHFAAFGSAEHLESLKTRGGGRRKQELAVEMDNLLAASELGLAEGAVSEAVAAFGGVVSNYEIRGPYLEGAQVARDFSRHPALAPVTARKLRLDSAVLLYAGGERAAASELFREVIDGAEVADPHDTLSQARLRLAIHLRESGRVAESRRMLEEMLESTPDHPLWRRASVLHNLATCQRQEGQTEASLASLREVLVLRRGQGDLQGELKVLTNMGTSFVELGRLEEGSRRYEEACRLLEDLDEPHLEASLLANMANLYLQAGRRQEAETARLRAISLARRVGCKVTEGVVLGNSGQVLLEEGRVAEGREKLETATRILEDVWPSGAGVFGADLSVLEARAGRFDAARDQMGIAESRLRGVHSEELGKLLAKKAEVERLSGDVPAASAALSEAEAIAESLGVKPDSELLGIVLRERARLSAGPGDSSGEGDDASPS
jgi:predicted ATPase/serine/threonine protein kinase